MIVSETQNLNDAFVHKVDKKEIPTCNIMGVDIAAINMMWLLQFTDKYVKQLSGDYICVANVHTTVVSYENHGFCSIQNHGIMTIPDGGPLSSIGKRRGYKMMSRTTGPSYMEEILKLSVTKGWKHYFYGSTEETLKKMRQVLKKTYPDILITGMYSPPFRAMTNNEDLEIIEKINAAAPDFIWVGLGAPKQEKWMADHQGRVHGLMVGVGAAFDYCAGNLKRAPEWMQKSNMEWFFRLLQEPKRLFSRYLRTNLKFIWHAFIKGK